MTIPSSTIVVPDPGLGIASVASTTPVFFGVASAGSVDTIAFYSSPVLLRNAHGYGPGVEAALQALAYAGGPVGFVRVTGAVAASNSAVTTAGGGPTVTVAGTGLFDFGARVEIMLGGALGVAQFRYTLDALQDDVVPAGANYTESLVIPAGGDYVVPGTGITITFASGTYVVTETYYWQTYVAGINSAGVTSAMAAATSSVVPWRHGHLILSQNCGDATASAALGSAAQSSLAAASTDGVFRSLTMNAAGQADESAANSISDWAAVSADRVLASHGYAQVIVQQSYPGRGLARVPASVPIAVRASGSLISTDLKRVSGNGLQDGGALPGVVSITHDERVVGSGLSAAKLSYLRTFSGRPGFFIGEGLLKSSTGSDFTLWPRRLVIDVACEITRELTTAFIGRGVRTNSDGTIAEADALRLESEVQNALEAALLGPTNAEGVPGHVSRVEYRIDRTINIVLTEILEGDVSVGPLGYVKNIVTRVGYKIGGSSEEIEAS